MREVFIALAVILVTAAHCFNFGTLQYANGFSNEYIVNKIEVLSENKCKYILSPNNDLSLQYNLVAECGLYSINDRLQLIKRGK